MTRNHTSRITKRATRYSTPHTAWRWAKSRYHNWRTSNRIPRVGQVDFGDFRRLSPFSSKFGADRGTVIDRYYIEAFLNKHRADVKGRVLEVGDNNYTIKYGGEKVTKSDVLHVEQGNPSATIVADLACADEIPSDTFDCIIFTQTIQMIYDLRAAMHHLYRILKPDGVILMTTHGTSKIGDHSENHNWCVHWRMTEDSARRLFREQFPAKYMHVEGHGNLLVTTAFLYGVAAEELTEEELNTYDPLYQALITARAVKPHPLLGQ